MNILCTGLVYCKERYSKMFGLRNRVHVSTVVGIIVIYVLRFDAK